MVVALDESAMAAIWAAARSGVLATVLQRVRENGLASFPLTVVVMA